MGEIADCLQKYIFPSVYPELFNNDTTLEISEFDPLFNLRTSDRPYQARKTYEVAAEETGEMDSP